MTQETSFRLRRRSRRERFPYLWVVWTKNWRIFRRHTTWWETVKVCARMAWWFLK